MNVHVDMIRNHPDFILETDGARMQDPRFVVFRKIPFLKVWWIKTVVRWYDNIKDYLRMLEDRETGMNFTVHRKEAR